MRACPRPRPVSCPNSKPAFIHASIRKELLPGMAKGLSGWQPACSLLVVILAQAGIHACMDAGRSASSAVRLSAPKTEPLRKRGQGVKGWQVLPDAALGYRAHVLSFPRCGNDLFKPLDSGLRRNDSFLFAVTPFVSLLFFSCPPRRHSSEDWNPGGARG